MLRQKLELWEENLSVAVSLLVLKLAEKFSKAAASHIISTDYAKLDCITSIMASIFSRCQPLAFWKVFFPVLNSVFNLHGATLMARENDRFLKLVTFHLLRLAVFRNDSIRIRAVIGLQILIRNSFYYFMNTTRLRVMLTITLSELLSEVQVTRMRSDGSLEEIGEAQFLRKSLEEMADEGRSSDLVRECRLPVNMLESIHKGTTDNRWSWFEVKYLSDCILLALNAGIKHALLVNSGVLIVCTAFLSGEPATRLQSQELQQLIAALLEFMAVCKRAIRVHFRLIGEEDQDFHTQLVNGFQSLTAELSHYIPAILSEL